MPGKNERECFCTPFFLLNKLMNTKQLVDYLSKFVTDERLNIFDQVLANRTRYLTVALEDIYQPHNASAVLRSMDCFGVQDVHIIENQNEYNINPDVALGASKCLNLYRYNREENNTLDAIQYLRNNGYRIISTTPHSEDVQVQDFNLESGKAAIFFGTEMRGLSKTVLDHSDEYLKIPMYGFTESFNISVSAAIILYQLTLKLKESEIKWQLSDDEVINLKYEWLKKSIKRSELLIDEFLSKKTNN